MMDARDVVADGIASPAPGLVCRSMVPADFLAPSAYAAGSGYSSVALAITNGQRKGAA